MYDDDRSKVALERQPCKPDYESMATKVQKEIVIFNNLRTALHDFVECVGRHSMRSKPGTLSELFGKLELDVREREKNLAMLLEMIEKE